MVAMVKEEVMLGHLLPIPTGARWRDKVYVCGGRQQWWQKQIEERRI